MAKKSKKNILFIFLITAIILVVIGLLGGLYVFNYYQSAPSDDLTLYPFTITSGETAADIALRLEQDGFIQHELMFRYVVLKEEIVLQAGEYQISKNLSVTDLASELTLGTFDTEITILEGWRREEIVDYLFAENMLPQISQRDKGILQTRLDLINKIKEGYFFPDTYILSKDTSLSELVQIANDNFNAKVDQEILLKFEAQGLTLDQAIILASIVEREANTTESRPVVASILLKRYQSDWPLEADATVQYVMADRDCVNVIECQWWSKDIYEADLQLDSPYNTRKYFGFPPEAICNPSLESIRAVAEATSTDYWFYLTGHDGKMYYSKTLEEHNQNIVNQL